MITLIDYGCGNIAAFYNIYKSLNISVTVARQVKDLENASHLILPGVGSFDYVMKSFNRSGLRDRVEKLVYESQCSVLGVCAGMQILADKSDEGIEQGLGWIPGYIRRFDASLIPYTTKYPHMGWNNISTQVGPLFDGMPDKPRFYFVHSYYFDPSDELSCIASCHYGIKFSAAVGKNRIFGVQFHPEKSHAIGTKLLLNFSML